MTRAQILAHKSFLCHQRSQTRGPWATYILPTRYMVCPAWCLNIVSKVNVPGQGTPSLNTSAALPGLSSCSQPICPPVVSKNMRACVFATPT